MGIQWGDVPTWCAAVGTVGTLVVALWQVRSDLARRRRAEDRAQADLVSGWYGRETDTNAVLYVCNASPQPVYEAVVSLTINGQHGENLPIDFRAVLPTLAPGRWAVSVSIGWAGMSAYPTVEIGFTDRRGDNHWIRRPNGILEKITESAIEHYDIARPFMVAYAEGA